MPFLKNAQSNVLVSSIQLVLVQLHIEILSSFFHWVSMLMAFHLCSHCSWKWRPKKFIIAHNHGPWCVYNQKCQGLES
jgi:hypothetical protein